jgi:hypothetical protein
VRFDHRLGPGYADMGIVEVFICSSPGEARTPRVVVMRVACAPANEAVMYLRRRNEGSHAHAQGGDGRGRRCTGHMHVVERTATYGSSVPLSSSAGNPLAMKQCTRSSSATWWVKIERSAAAKVGRLRAQQQSRPYTVQVKAMRGLLYSTAARPSRVGATSWPTCSQLGTCRHLIQRRSPLDSATDSWQRLS